MKAQAHEESDHADVLAQYVMKRGGQAKVGAVDAVPQEWASPLDVFEHVYKHECHVSELIDKLVDVASAEKDKASQDFLWGFVREQVEELSLIHIFSGVVNNLFDQEYISDATDGSNHDWQTAYGIFYGFGRTYNLKLKLNF